MYRKSITETEWVRITDDSLILLVSIQSIDNACIRTKIDSLLSEDFINGDMFVGCTEEEFNKAYTRAIKMIDL